MKMKKLFALLLTAVMVLSLVACGGGDDTAADTGDGETAEETGLTLGYDAATGEEVFGPVYDEWSEKTDDELYEMAKEEGGTIETVAKAKKIARRMIIEASMCRREECDLSELILGVECGGSDATSGLVSNPVMGLVSDRVVAEGGTALFSETVEMIGAEHILARRAATPEVGQKILDYVRFREDEQIAAGEDVRKTQPSPGNKDGGITTLEEKSLGCIHKGGHTPVVDMIDCAHAPTKKGLVLMDTPCYDMLSVTAKAAGGAQLIVFTTGRGNAIGNPVVPVMKVTANGDTYRKLSDNIDLDMSPVLERDMSLEEMADITLRQIVDTLSGRLTSAEVLKLGYSETIISRACEYC